MAFNFTRDMYQEWRNTLKQNHEEALEKLRQQHCADLDQLGRLFSVVQDDSPPIARPATGGNAKMGKPTPSSKPARPAAPLRRRRLDDILPDDVVIAAVQGLSEFSLGDVSNRLAATGYRAIDRDTIKAVLGRMTGRGKIRITKIGTGGKRPNIYAVVPAPIAHDVPEGAAQQTP